MNHFDGNLSSENRWKNDLLNEQRKQTALLEQIAQLLKDRSVKPVPKNSPQKARK